MTIVAFIVAVLLRSIFGTCGMGLFFADRVRDRANEDARAYSREFHPGWTHPTVSCQSVDSDSDGYVTCTIGDGANATEAIECRVSRVTNYKRGCRPMRAAVRVRGTTSE